MGGSGIVTARLGLDTERGVCSPPLGGRAVSYERGTPVTNASLCRQAKAAKAPKKITGFPKKLLISLDKVIQGVQGYLAHKKIPPPRTLQKCYA